MSKQSLLQSLFRVSLFFETMSCYKKSIQKLELCNFFQLTANVLALGEVADLV